MTIGRYELAPVAAFGLYLGLLGVDLLGASSALHAITQFLLLPVLVATVFSAVHYAENIAHRLGEPYGTLVLTFAVTVIEVALIASLMLAQGASPALARDTVFSVIMIVCNGLVGLCLLLGGMKYREQGFLVTGASAYLSVLLCLGTITLILPNFTNSHPGPFFTAEQLVFISLMTTLLYGAFLYIQMVSHQDYFATDTPDAVAAHGPAPLSSIAWLVASVLGVVLLAKKFATVVAGILSSLNAPSAFGGVIVALLILAPEGVAAVRAARRDQLQRSINLALGSSLATIGLTVPAVATVNVLLQKDLVLGLAPKDMMLLALTFLISVVTFGTGRTNILFGFVHLVIFATFLFLLFAP